MFAAESISGRIIRRNAFWLFIKLFVIASTPRRVFGLNAHIQWTGAIANQSLKNVPGGTDVLGK